MKEQKKSKQAEVRRLENNPPKATNIHIAAKSPPLLKRNAELFLQSQTDSSLLRDAELREFSILFDDAIFSNHEVWAWKQLCERKHLWPLWEHLSNFQHPPEFIFVAVQESIVAAYHEVASDKLDFSRDLIERDKATFSDIARLTHKLMELLAYIPDVDPGLKADIDGFLDESDLSKLLLKLLSKTTACRWPEREFDCLYGGNQEGSMEAEDIKHDETYSVYQRTKTKQETIDPDYSNKKWRKFAYKRNDKLFDGEEYLWHERENPESTSGREVVFREIEDCPPKFEPPNIKNIAADVLKARGQDARLLRLASTNMDNFSEDRSLDFEAFNSQTHNKAALWLPIDCWARLITVFFQPNETMMPDSSGPEARKVKRIIQPNRKCHIKYHPNR